MSARGPPDGRAGQAACRYLCEASARAALALLVMMVVVKMVGGVMVVVMRVLMFMITRGGTGAAGTGAGCLAEPRAARLWRDGLSARMRGELLLGQRGRGVRLSALHVKR